MPEQSRQRSRSAPVGRDGHSAVELTTWAGHLAYSADSVYYPTSVVEVQELVARLSRVKALGTRHSFNTIADSPGAVLISLSELAGGHHRCRGDDGVGDRWNSLRGPGGRAARPMATGCTTPAPCRTSRWPARPRPEPTAPATATASCGPIPFRLLRPNHGTGDSRGGRVGSGTRCGSGRTAPSRRN
jgi:hypothetical protein